MDDMDALARACAVGMGTGPRYLDGAQHHAHRAVRRRGREGCVQAALPDHRGSSMSCRSRSRVSAVCGARRTRGSDDISDDVGSVTSPRVLANLSLREVTYPPLPPNARPAPGRTTDDRKDTDTVMTIHDMYLSLSRSIN